MTDYANLVIRWALAYLLIINSIDTVTNNNSIASGNIWIDDLIMLAAVINIGGGILLASGWQLRNTAVVLAISTVLFALIYQEPVALAITMGLLVLAYNAKDLLPERDNKNLSASCNESSGSGNKTTTSATTSIVKRNTCGC
ncbi:hypothetical protein [Kaarinaea lacus]